MKKLLIVIVILSITILKSCKKISQAKQSVQEIYSKLNEGAFDTKIVSFSVIPSPNLDDMLPLKNIFRGKQIIGFGEATHGTAEFQTVKHRAFQLLATELQFKNLVIEENFSAVVPVNGFINTGIGDVTALLNGLRSSIFKTIEFRNLIIWMKDFNTGKNDVDKVRLFGMDAQNTSYSANAAKDFIARYEPSYLNTYSTLCNSFFADLTNYNSEQEAMAALPQLKQNIISVKNHINSVSALYIIGAGQKQYELLLQHLNIIEQAINQFISYTINASEGFAARDLNMATNVKWIENFEGNGARIMVWAHNGHLNLQKQVYFNKGAINVLGTNLRNMYGNAFYTAAFIFNEGKFDAVNTSNGSTQVFTITPYTKAYLTNALSRFKKLCFFYDLSTSTSQIFGDTFNGKFYFYQVGAGYDNNIKNALWEYNLSLEFDGFIFIDKITAFTPF